MLSTRHEVAPVRFIQKRRPGKPRLPVWVMTDARYSNIRQAPRMRLERVQLGLHRPRKRTSVTRDGTSTSHPATGGRLAPQARSGGEREQPDFVEDTPERGLGRKT